jgi:hypothetical protein
MKKLVTLSVFLPSMAFGQALVSTLSQNRTALLEDFTGIHCGYCPDGHAIMEAIDAANPGKVSLVGIHAGPFATPNTGEPDFRTPDGNALDAYLNPSGYPSGMVNRHYFDGDQELGRGAWTDDVAQMLALPSPVNLGVESSFDSNTGVLTVHVQLYYTADSPGDNDRIAVLVTEDHLYGWQTDYGNGDNPNYDHKHVLRDYITDIWGEEVATTTAGTTVDRTYTLTVPAEWNMANCNVTAFVGEYQSDVYQSRTVPAVDGATEVAGSLGMFSEAYKAGTDGTASPFTTNLVNELDVSGNFVVDIVENGAPASWTASASVDGNAVADGGTVTLAAGANVPVVLNVTPDATPGIGNYQLVITSQDFPNAAPLVQDVHVISGVHDLIVTNPEAEPWEALYVNAMQQAGETFFATTTRADFVKFGQANALGGVLNVYRNVSWTFPSLTEDEVAVLTTFMDNGGNLMIAGQDIGWDQSGATGSYGTAATQAFYTNYLLADFVTDGSSASNLVNFTDGDAVFGDVPNSSIANVFNNNTYPDQMLPIAPATGILTYNTGTSIGGIRAQTANYKLVYFGVGPEQMGDAAVGKQMVELSHDWFYGLTSVEEFDAAIGSLGQAWPVPADNMLNIPVDGRHLSDAGLEVFDGMGRKVTEQALTGGDVIHLPTNDLANGVYSFRLRTGTGAGSAHSFVVAH